MQAQALAVARLPGRKFGAAVLAVSGEGFGVDGVGFAERSKRADEGFDLAGVGSVGGNAGGDERGEQGVFVTAGGFTDDEAGRLEPRGEVRQGLRRVGDRVRAAAHGVENDDDGLADVATDEARGRGGVRHLRLSSVSLGLSAGVHRRDGGPFNSSSVQGKREDGPDDGGLRAPLRDGQSPRAPIRAAAQIGASPSSGTLFSNQSPRDNCEEP